VHSSVTRLVESYGYAVVFFFVAVESLGIPLPGETVLVTAAALAALGHLNIWLVIAVAAAGGIIGDASGYWIGRLGGLALLKRGIPADTALTTGGEGQVAAVIDAESMPAADATGAGRLAVARLRGVSR